MSDPASPGDHPASPVHDDNLGTSHSCFWLAAHISATFASVSVAALGTYQSAYQNLTSFSELSSVARSPSKPQPRGLWFYHLSSEAI
jgi:hypothetical protein